MTTWLAAEHGAAAVSDLAEELAADLAEAFDALAAAEGRPALAVLDGWFHDVPDPPLAAAAAPAGAADPGRPPAAPDPRSSRPRRARRDRRARPRRRTTAVPRAGSGGHRAATGEDEAEALVTARKIRELRETTGQHGEQLAAVGEQLRALAEQVAQTGARHTDLAAAVSEDLAPRVGGAAAAGHRGTRPAPRRRRRPAGRAPRAGQDQERRRSTGPR